ncbi:MAG: menaquinone biosynthesis protein [Deltaproteobacteria bacterium]|nr:menaquinone biosynthesis protein [Deltaproteobacteria bacterium]
MARIGMVNYINTAPIYEVWKATINRPDWQVTEAPPSALNRLLAAGELDLGFVSSYEYAARPAKYRILADLSISATGPVGSVFLFSTVAPAELTGRLVLLTGQSDTSIRLVRIILEEFFHVRPEYVVGEISGRREPDGKIGAVLAIGDEALRIKFENRYPVQIDLAEFWHQTTGLPFVFSICAIREDFVRSEPETALAIRDALLHCRAAGLERTIAPCKTALADSVDPAACFRYLQGIEYDLGPTKQQALEKFFTYLISRNEADEQALPLKIFPAI